jgi:hypothetical protein
LEVRGLAAEIMGLVVLLIAALWQVSVTDWFDTFPARSQYFVQEAANIAVLQALEKNALAWNQNDPERRKALFQAAGAALSWRFGAPLQLLP